MRRLGLVGLAVVVSSCLLEVVIAMTHLDFKLLRPLLLIVEGMPFTANRQCFQTSSNAERLYETIPNTETVWLKCTHPAERKYGSPAGRKNIRIRINDLGFRDDEDRSPIKPKGVFRIIIFGGSNVFGPSVNNEDTYPAVMQELLNRQQPGRFEVWNGGLHAYVLSQKVAYAETVIKLYNPDIVIMSHENDGRRPFLNTELQLAPIFDKNKYLYQENIPLIFFDHRLLQVLHEWFVVRWRLYRLAVVAASRVCIGWASAPKWYGEQVGEGGRRWGSRCSRAGDIESFRMFRQFLQEETVARIVFLKREPFGWSTKMGANVLQLNLHEVLHQQPSEEYSAIHPPSHVYRFYAEWIIDELKAKGFLPSEIKEAFSQHRV